MQEKVIKQFTIRKGNIQHMTSKKLKGSSCQKQIFGHLAAHVKTSALQENKKALLKAEEAPCSLRLSDALKNELGGRRRYLPYLSWRMLKLSYPAMEDGILQGCLLKWTKSGTMLNGQFSTLPMSSLKTEKEFILSDILEEKVPDKYFLSDDKVRILLDQTQKSE